jgi:hypothetical protein
VRESKIEKHLKRAVMTAGGVSEKFKSPSKRNVPDQLVSWPENPMFHKSYAHCDFVELKATGVAPSEAQIRDHNRRRRHGFRVLVLDNFHDIDGYVLSKVRRT